MGFSADPGPLPFTTIRDGKWMNRLEGVPPFVEITGEHGCRMPRQVVKVAWRRPITAESARREGLHIPPVYAGKPLFAIRLTRASAEELRAAGIPEVSHG